MKEIDIYDRLGSGEFSPTFLRLREQGRLDERLSPNPVEVADTLAHNILSTNRPTVQIVHSLSMFSGMTSSVIGACSILEKEEVLVNAFQPAAALRYDGQESQILNNQSDIKQKMRFSAEVIPDNDLTSLLKRLQGVELEGKKQVVVIDDAQLFITQNGKSKEAINVISMLQDMGFSVILSGITRTYEGEPFTFMQDLVDFAKDQYTWNPIEMSTQCVCCDKRAKGTRRYELHDGKPPTIAKKGTPILAGGPDRYVPVCMDEHLSYSV